LVTRARNKKNESSIHVAVLGYDPLRFVGLRTLLEKERDFTIHAVELNDLAQPTPASIVLIGPHGIGSILDMVATIRTLRPQVKIVVSGARLSDEAMLRAISAGVKGCLDEAAPADEYKQGLREVHAGSMWVPHRILAKFVERATMRPKKSAGRVRLSERELQVLELLVAGCTNRQIGDELGIEERTVKSHVSKLMEKAGVDNRIGLSVYAVKNALFVRP